MIRFFRSPICLVAFVFAGCSSQAEPDYQGTPELTVRGSIVAAGTTSPHPAEAALLWSSFDPSVEGGLRLVGSSVPVTGTFPASFEMNVFVPPPDSALLPLAPGVEGGFPLQPGQPAEMAVAYVVALGANADHANVSPDDILGTSPDAIVFYNKHPIQPASPSGQVLALFNAPLTQGYHLISIVQPTPAQRTAFLQCKSGGVCMKIIMPPNTPPAEIAINDNDLAKCTAATPGATVCNLWAIPAPTPQQQQETSACLDLIDAHRGKGCPHPWSFSQAGTSTSISVVMGEKPWDLFR